MKFYLKLLFAVGAISTLTACNTVEGVGRDLEKLGNSIKESADE